ncbi:MAG: DUF1848 domain-containing protein [Firmicutes bacterium]|nr:DUF1848 domain-containing protein [Bacillota bacterium]
MIISASRRTDIPACYSDWFMNRIREGHVCVRNPFQTSQVTCVELDPQKVDCIVFWTKDPGPMMKYLPELSERGFQYCFQFTVTPYNNRLEPGVRPKAEIEETLIELSKRIGRERVLWRYDPIIFSDQMTVEWHKKQFLRLCEKFAPYVSRVTISFLDLYPRLLEKNLLAATRDEMVRTADAIGRTAFYYGLEAVTCSEAMDFSKLGIGRGSCIDPKVISKIVGLPLRIPKDPSQRAHCQCYQSVDIGAYNTCQAECIYWYATSRVGRQEAMRQGHDANGELLLGTLKENERPSFKKTESNKIMQISMWDHLT